MRLVGYRKITRGVKIFVSNVVAPLAFLVGIPFLILLLLEHLQATLLTVLTSPGSCIITALSVAILFVFLAETVHAIIWVVCGRESRPNGETHERRD